jgi:isopropanol dehydrogenase (NADP+)
VFAQGPVRLMATAGAKFRGAGLIIGIDSIPRRQELSRYYGADLIVDPTKPDALSKIIDVSGGRGVDSAVEALGADITFQNAIKVTKPGGTISNVGYHGEGEFVRIPRLDWGVGMAEKTIRTSLCPGGSLRLGRLLRLLENKRIDPTKMTTHTFKFDEADKGFETMDKKLDGVIKPLVKF